LPDAGVGADLMRLNVCEVMHSHVARSWLLHRRLSGGFRMPEYHK
jgi:hypothetical protein